METSDHPDYKSGDAVVLTGWGVGESHLGAYAERARVKGDWLVPLPDGLKPEEAMAVGTAGYTAMLCVMALDSHGLTPADGPAIVTGASGGVGSVAVALLAKAGWHVIAVTGRSGEADYLTSLGAAEIMDRKELANPGKPLAKERWAAGIDAVGSTTLANLLASTKADGAIAACGLAGGMDLPTSVAPFILRGVTLFGINKCHHPVAKAQGSLGADRARPRPKPPRQNDEHSATFEGGDARRGNPRGADAWPHRRHHWVTRSGTVMLAEHCRLHEQCICQRA